MTPSLPRAAFPLAAIGLVALVGCQRIGEPAAGQAIADALTVPDLSGNQFDPSALAGKRALVMFWSTSCGTCIDELPEIQKVADAGDCDVVTVVVKGAPDRARDLARGLALDVPVLVDDGGKLRSMLAIDATPTTFALDPEGRAVRFVRGGYGAERLAKLCRG